MSMMVAVQHLLAVAVFVGVPLWDRSLTPRMKRGGPGARRAGYAEIVGVLWALAAACAVAVPVGQLWQTPIRADDVAWLPLVGHAGQGARSVTDGVAIGLLIGALVPAVMVMASPALRASFARRLEPMRWFLPVTTAERWWFVAVSVSAGVCEEVVYRGFLLRYLHAGPWALPAGAALAVMAVAFGLAHLYQGWLGVLTTGLLGLVFGGLFVATGTLLIPIVLHAVIDLRLLAMLPRQTSTSST